MYGKFTEIVADSNMDTHLGDIGAAADPDGSLHGQLRAIAEGGGIELDLSAAPVQVALSTTTARSAQLAVGTFIVKTDARTFVRQGAVTVDATVTTDFVLEAGVAYVLQVTDTATLGYLAGITAVGTGTMDIQATQ